MPARDSTGDVESSLSSELTCTAEKYELPEPEKSGDWSLGSIAIVFIWIILSTSVILFNKYIIENRKFRFRRCSDYDEDDHS